MLLLCLNYIRKWRIAANRGTGGWMGCCNTGTSITEANLLKSLLINKNIRSWLWLAGSLSSASQKVRSQVWKLLLSGRVLHEFIEKEPWIWQFWWNIAKLLIHYTSVPEGEIQVETVQRVANYTSPFLGRIMGRTCPGATRSIYLVFCDFERLVVDSFLRCYYRGLVIIGFVWMTMDGHWNGGCKHDNLLQKTGEL